MTSISSHVADADAISRCRREVSTARMEPGVQHYAVDLVRRTRTHPFCSLWSEPSRSVALLLCSKALAAIRGREFSTPDMCATLLGRCCVTD